MAEHTPGPWFVIEDPADRELWIRARDAEWLARVWGQRPEANSNANLIAAAPELLSIVGRLVDTLPRGCMHVPTYLIEASQDVLRAVDEGRLP